MTTVLPALLVVIYVVTVWLHVICRQSGINSRVDIANDVLKTFMFSLPLSIKLILRSFFLLLKCILLSDGGQTEKHSESTLRMYILPLFDFNKMYH